MSAIRQERFAGGLVFEWADEWFKFTWNTKELELPAMRRALWRNPLTNEEHFGIVASETGDKRPKVIVDGKGSEWERRGHSPVTAESRGAVREVRATHDEEYLYLRLKTDKPAGTTPVTIGLDTRPGTNVGLPGLGSTMPEADVAVTLGTGRRATLRLAAWTDILSFQYGVAQEFMKVDRKALRRGSGVWHRPRLILNRPFVTRDTREQHFIELADIGRLRWGTANPAQRGFDDRVLVASKRHTVEVRLPWMMLGYSDPSSHQVMVPHTRGPVTSKRTGRIQISTTAGGQQLRTAGYDWEDWNVVEFHERRKAGWDVLAAGFDRAAAAPQE